jgi:hypothetical protein
MLSSVSRRVSLPMTLEASKRPTVDVVRRRLGGRASTEAGAGAIVALDLGGVPRLGVVLFVRGDALDVWSEPGVVRRVLRSSARPFGHEGGNDALRAVAADAQVFASLVEGASVGYHDGERLGEGRLVEKCRFGGIVERADGTLMGVAFRKLWPRAHALA